MLDTDTKRRIDTARDILVGKLPDPKSQVEQITIALIYKFMDDMDAQSEELGGQRTFLSGEFQKYGWARLMRGDLGGHEKLNLYAEAITRMPENPGVPPLFRDIFKNAFLPYRDPETLRAFLKVIDEFEYDHSERLGDAFEYLLSVLGSQGDAGQFRTPRHIIDFIVQIIDPKKDETVLDPACGTAGFLISAYKHILRANLDENGNSTLTPDERQKLATNFRGYDISPDMVRLSLVNMYLHGFPDPQIHEYDTLTSLDRWNEHADVILANPPFMSPKGGIQPHNRFSVQSKRSEVLFVDYIAEHLRTEGRAGVIVPEGVVEREDAAYKKLRDLLIREHLSAVISLPAGAFHPYTRVKTSVLVLDRRRARANEPVLFSRVDSLGVSLNSARTTSTGNDLPAVLSDYAAFGDGGEVSAQSWVVSRELLLNPSKSLAGMRYKPRRLGATQRWVRIGDVCTVTKGKSSSTKTPPGPFPLIVRGEEPLTSATYEFEGEAVCVPLLSLAHGRGQIKRVHFARGRYAVANLLAVVRPRDENVVDTRYLYLVLDALKEQVAARMQGTVYVSLKVSDLEEFEIPLPPIAEQAAIGTRYDAMQAAIAEHRQRIETMERSLLADLATLAGLN